MALNSLVSADVPLRSLLIQPLTDYYAADHTEGAISVAFVHRLSVCLSIANIANNSRTQRPSMPKFGMKVPHLRCD